jgi:hypothetical protein
MTRSRQLPPLASKLVYLVLVVEGSFTDIHLELELQ